MRTSFLLFLALFLCSCSAGLRFNHDKVAALELRQLRSTEYVNLFDEPFRTSNTVTADGKYKHAWYYSAIRDYLIGNVSRRTLLLEFKDDELNAYLYTSSFDTDRTQIDLSKVDRIKIGASSKNDLLPLLGKPSGKALCPSVWGEFKDKCAKASEVWAWMKIDKTGSVLRIDNRGSKSLFVAFDPAGLVVDLKAIEND
jgi:hypothetical protein